MVRSRLAEVGPAVQGHADPFLCRGQEIPSGTSEPLLLEMNYRESKAHETEPKQISRNTLSLVSAIHLSTSLVAAKGSVTVTDQKRLVKL